MAITERYQGLNRHERMRRHKRKMKRRYAVRYGEYETALSVLADRRRAEVEDEDNWWYKRHSQRARNKGFTYWDNYYLSGRRGFAKRQTSKCIRAQYREMLARMDPEDVPAYRGADYEKTFDYLWTIW